MAVYAQFGGNPCAGERTETRPCETTKGCPLEDGCGNRFHCRSGKCVSQSLVCNGDQDCEEDGEDERACNPQQQFIVCTDAALPPNIELLGQGYDVVTGKRRASVINTKSFGGQCRTIYSGVNNNIYRLPLSTLQYNFMVKVKNDFSDEMFTSEWHYAKDIVNRQTVHGTTTGHHNYDFHKIHDTTKIYRILVLKNDIEVAQFQSNSPQYLPISEEFWKALAKLPSVYDYGAYRKVLERFGTHYLSEGSLGGSFKVVARVDEETEKQMESEIESHHECSKTIRFFLIFPISVEKCKNYDRPNYRPPSTGNGRNNSAHGVDIAGGAPAHIAALGNMQPDTLDKNWEMYSNWADSIRSFPKVTKQKLRPLSELVKEVQCAGVKKLYLRRAIEQYIGESDPCHCQPCRNNGLAVMDGDVCICICKHRTLGPACEQGSEIEGQQGVIHGSWTCWSSWSACSGNRRSRQRSCSNPAPQNGGQSCIGESAETSDCEDQDIQYLKTMEPQCFDWTLPPSQKCGDPPALVNGYILDPKDIYLVGSRVQYTCTEGFHLLGQSTLECTTDQTWSASPGLCTISSCKIGALADDVIASPLKPSYGIGETITLSCPEGRQLLGEATIICDASLHFSPDPAGIKCSPASVPQLIIPSVQCKQWEKSSKGQCVCKMPFECGSSLELCATSPVTGKSILLSVCKLHALQCIKKNHEIAEDSACKWPLRSTTTDCTNCQMWETCNDQTNECHCKDSADCLIQGSDVCVRVGENATEATQTMSECEAGLRRCKGETVSVVSILPCTS